MKKNIKKSSTIVKRAIFSSRYPAKGVKEMIAMSRALDKVRGEKVSEHDKIVECSQNDKGISRNSRGGVPHRRDVWQGRQLDGKMVEADDWLGEYGTSTERRRRLFGGMVFPKENGIGSRVIHTPGG